MRPSFFERLNHAGAFALLMAVGCGQGSPSEASSVGPFLTPQGAQQLSGQRPREVATLAPSAPIADSTTIDVAIGLALADDAAVDGLVRDLYDPASPRYHRFLTPDEYTKKFSPSVESYQAVLDFAARNQLTVVRKTPNRRLVHVRGSALAINRAFHVTLQQYQHPTEARMFYAADREPSLDLDVPIKFIVGLDDLHPPRRIHDPNAMSHQAPQAGGSGSGGRYTGYDFRNAYAPGVGAVGFGQTVGILEKFAYNPNDITTYEDGSGFPYHVWLQNVYVDGFTGGNPATCTTDCIGYIEAATDIEMALSMAPGLRQISVYGFAGDNASILDVLDEMAHPTQGEPLPAQISTSYYINYGNGAVYPPLTQLAAQGQAFFVASGDWGSYDESKGGGDFAPNDDPHVVSVGGTILTTAANAAWSEETTWWLSTSTATGGGYSPWTLDPEFAIPSWQAGMNFAAFGGSPFVRNMPDVSLVADNISVYFNGSWQGIAGTSASSPLWAGFMALVNERAVETKGAVIGLPTPAIYAIERSGICETCFHDITTGNNFSLANPSSYSAVPGYDLCTGWGTPNGQPLIDALVTYPCASGTVFEADFGGCVSYSQLAAAWTTVMAPAS
jgi:subtilase family serine protease